MKTTGTLIILLLAGMLKAQTFQISGHVSDELKLPIPFATILVENGQGTAADESGHFYLELPPGEHFFQISALGFESLGLTCILNQDTMLNVILINTSHELDLLVVSGSLYERKLTEETTSIDVIGQELLRNNNVVSLADGVQKAPGVYLLDNQINIRGGTGFTYGAGSRVMVVLDDQPVLSSDRGDVSIHLLPMEIVQQMEVIKGASSVLYGSSAINGVVALRTAWPGSEPVNTVSVYNGIFDNPDSAHYKWWGPPPVYSGFNFSHLKQYEKVDLVLSGHASRNNSNLEGQFSNRARLTWKTRMHTGKDNRISYGINGNILLNDEGIFFLFADADTNLYRAFGGPYDSAFTTLLNWTYRLTTIDPWLNIHDNHDGNHRIRSRFYHTGVTYSDTTSGNSWLQNLDYQYNRAFKDFVITTGVSGYYFHVNDDDLGHHSGFSGGAYLQADQKLFQRLNINAGMREEFYLLDSVDFVAVPIFKAGASYRLWPQTFIRASYGQGFRVPSLVERYAKTKLGILYIFPNPDITAEYGWNAEFAVKKTWSNDYFTGYTDAAFYVTDYYDMTEFIFNQYIGEGIGFKSLNTGRARMAGLELTAAGEGSVFGLPYSIVGGYNYLYPADLSSDSALYNWGDFLGNFVDGFNNTDSAFVSHILKYRFRHMLRFDAQADPGRMMFGLVVNYYSYMENIDYVFEKFGIPEGLSDFRARHTDGDWIWDVRAGYHFNDKVTANFFVRNLTNRVYSIRPGKTEWNRNYILQLQVNI